MRKFKVANVHCENCAKTIKNALKDEFGEIGVDLNTEPRTINLEISDDKIDALKDALDDIGFEFIEEVK